MASRAVRPLTTIVLMAVLLVAALAVSLQLGTTRLSPSDVLGALLGHGSWLEELIVVQTRLPRVLVCALVGAGLAVAGVLLQGLSRNDLASPSTVGVSAGSGLGMMVLLVFLPREAARQPWLLPLGAVAGAIGTTALVFSIAYRRGRVLPARLLLVGIAVGYGAGAAMLLLALRMDFVTYSYVTSWISGSLAGSDWNAIRVLAPSACILIPAAYSRARALNVMALGDSVAASLGAPVERERLTSMVLATMITSASVAVAGNISFLGLAAPHLARRLVGPDHRALFPAAALCGATLLVVADSLGRQLFAPLEMPAGVFVGVLGGIYFIYLLARSRG
jgi:iron complex transport system permease protein